MPSDAGSLSLLARQPFKSGVVSFGYRSDLCLTDISAGKSGYSSRRLKRNERKKKTGSKTIASLRLSRDFVSARECDNLRDNCSRNNYYNVRSNRCKVSRGHPLLDTNYKNRLAINPTWRHRRRRRRRELLASHDVAFVVANETSQARRGEARRGEARILRETYVVDIVEHRGARSQCRITP